MRILGLDFGERTVGVAISDELFLTAQPLETIFRKEENKLRRTCARIEELIAEYQVTEIVIGLPLHMDDSVSLRSEKCVEFQQMVARRTGLPVFMQDERLTTVEAEEVLDEMGVPRREQKAYIDKIAASFILQDYLNQKEKK